MKLEDALHIAEKAAQDELSEKRMMHVRGTAAEAAALGELFVRAGMLSRMDAGRLRVAAMLHDITKEKTKEEQMELCRRYRIALTPCEEENGKLHHAITGGHYARELVGQRIADDAVCSAIRRHTVGDGNMKLTETLLYLADWIEPTRTWPTCLELRRMFYGPGPQNMTAEQLSAHLDAVVIRSCELAMAELIEGGQTIDPHTVAMRNALILKSRLAPKV